MSAANKQSVSNWSRISQEPRPLVDFVIIGAMRAGTTALHHWLTGQPEVTMARMKETDYFIAEKNFSRGENWYEAQFKAAQFDKGQSDKGQSFSAASMRGDASPNYAKRDIFADVPERVHAANPAAKILFIARDPVMRALSHYYHSSATGQKMPRPETLLASDVGTHILNTSRYHYQLAPWYALFGHNAIHIIDFDLLRKDPATVQKDLCAFLGLSIGSQGTPIEPFNSREDLATLPPWWTRLRETTLGQSLRRQFSATTKNHIKQLMGKKKLPAQQIFPERIIEEMSAQLKPDAALFREETGMSFSAWSV